MPYFIYLVSYNQSWSMVVDIILTCLLFSAVVVFSVVLKLSKRSIAFIVSVLLLQILSILLELPFTKDLVLFIFLLTLGYLLLIYGKNEVGILKHPKHVKKQDALSTNETDQLFAVLNKAVTDLSASKTGALITLERKDSLDPFMQTSGVKVNAPASPELLETIFFNKTPLHDGATIIRGNIIASSAVFYQPTQKPLNGKYGSRHRAAIGISEVCDALTIVVSEETGKVSFTFKGELIAVPVASFVDKLKEYYF